MSPHTRTPRQPPGEHLVLLSVRVPEWLRDILQGRAEEDERSLSQTARTLIERALTADEAR